MLDWVNRTLKMMDTDTEIYDASIKTDNKNFYSTDPSFE